MSGDDQTKVSWRELWDGGHLARFSVLCLGVWLHAADDLLVATLMPSAVDEIGGATLINWTIALYQLGSIVAGAATGLAAVRLGLRPAMIGAACVYAIGCAASATAPDMATMLVGRLLQGLGGGCLVALAYGSVSRLFPPRLGPRLIAIMAAVWGSSAFLGPLIGGILASVGMWRLGFWAFAGQAMLFVGAVLLLFESPPTIQDSAPRRVPFGRLAIFSAGVLAIATAGIDVSLTTSPPLCLLALFLLWMFFRRDAWARGDSLFPRGSLDPAGPVGAGMVMVLATATATISFVVYGPLLVRTLYGAEPLVTGYIIAVEAVSWSLAAVAFSGATGDRERLVTRAGSALTTVAVAGLAIAMPHGSLVSLVPFAVLQGAGFGMAFGFIVRRVVAGTEPADREKASSALPTSQWMGYAIGSAASGIVANAAGFADGVTRASAGSVGFWVFAAFLPVALIGNIAAWRLTANRDPRPTLG